MLKDRQFMALFKQAANVTVYANALVLKPEMITLGEGARIDDFSRLEGGLGLNIGLFVHVCSFASILGGGSANLGDYCCLAQGARLLTGSETPGGVMSSAAPESIRKVKRGHTQMGPHAFVGANAVVMPGLTLGEGSVVGAGAVVLQSVPDWTIVAGVPAKVIGQREVIRL